MSALLGALLALTGVAIGFAIANEVQTRRIVKLWRVLEPRIANLEPPTTTELRVDDT